MPTRLRHEQTSVTKLKKNLLEKKNPKHEPNITFMEHPRYYFNWFFLSESTGHLLKQRSTETLILT